MTFRMTPPSGNPSLHDKLSSTKPGKAYSFHFTLSDIISDTYIIYNIWNVNKKLYFNGKKLSYHLYIIIMPSNVGND